jgi:hypothetical protein
METYTLTTLVDTPDVLVVRLTPPEGGEMQSTRIAFLPGGYIVIHGDLCPGGNGLISNGGYGADWFARGGKPLTPSYMAEKFRVPSVFIPSQAAEHLRECAEEEDDTARAANFLSLADDAEDIDERDPRQVGDFLENVEDLLDSPDHTEAFYGPEPRTMDLLIQIQAAFARLYQPAQLRKVS